MHVHVHAYVHVHVHVCSYFVQAMNVANSLTLMTSVTTGIHVVLKDGGLH